MLAVTAIAGTENAYAESRTLAVNINDNDVELNYYSESEYSEYSKIKKGYGGLKAVDEFGDSNTYVHASFSNTGLTDLSGIIFGIGFDVSASYIGKSEKVYTAIGLMVKAGYIFPLSTLTTLIGSISYAPQTLCISEDLENFSDFRIDLEVEVIDGGAVFVGYRDISYNLVNAPDYTFNQAPYAGFKLQFGG
jgi:hypothetical protein